MSDATTDLFAAIHANNPEGVRLLIAAEPRLLQVRSPSGLSPVLFAAYYHRPLVLDVLLEGDPELDLFEAAATGRLRPEQLTPQSELGRYNPDGLTPLHLACLFGRSEAAAALLSSGADLEAYSRSPHAAQALHLALGARQWDTAKLLLERGAPVNTAQAGGWTPLLLTVREGHAELVGELLARHADTQARTDEGDSALSLARDNGHEELLRHFPALKEERPQ